MKTIKIETSAACYAPSELPSHYRTLMQAAVEATSHAYAPYSAFSVGAALLLADGRIVTGSNQENAAYPSGLCAERVALFHAGHQYPDTAISAIAIAAAKQGIPIARISPCGACRQVLLEAEERQGTPIGVLLCGAAEVWIVDRAASLLPFCFDAADLISPAAEHLQ